MNTSHPRQDLLKSLYATRKKPLLHLERPKTGGYALEMRPYPSSGCRCCLAGAAGSCLTTTRSPHSERPATAAASALLFSSILIKERSKGARRGPTKLAHYTVTLQKKWTFQCHLNLCDEQSIQISARSSNIRAFGSPKGSEKYEMHGFV